MQNYFQLRQRQELWTHSSIKSLQGGDVNVARVSPLEDTHAYLPWIFVEVASVLLEPRLADKSPSVPCK